MCSAVMQVLQAERQAYVNKKTKAGSTPLRFAVKNGSVSAARHLIESGADCKTKDSQVGGRSWHTSIWCWARESIWC
jgi:ankyrin repeat protein